MLHKRFRLVAIGVLSFNQTVARCVAPHAVVLKASKLVIHSGQDGDFGHVLAPMLALEGCAGNTAPLAGR